MATEVRIRLPELHADQQRAYLINWPRKAVRAGRRWGKTVYGEVEGSETSIRGFPVGWFAPSYRMISETFDQFMEILGPLRAPGTSKQAGVIKLVTGGRIDFWSLENEDAGRSRRYKKVIIDEASFGKANLMDTWTRAIEPTLLDYSGEVIALSNTSGDDPDNFFWQLCKNPKHGFKEYHAPSISNPVIPLRLPDESFIAWQARRDAAFAKLQAETPPLVYAQEYMAEFVDWSGDAFFNEDHMLDNPVVPGQKGLPVPYPKHCTAVYATIDTATKTGKEHDGTAVVYWAFTAPGQGPFPLVILDWDISQIQGAMLEEWLPTVFQKLQIFAEQCGARGGSAGAWIEDKASGMVLLQHAQNRQWAAHAIDSKLTAMGKSERAISVSRYVYKRLVKFSDVAYNKVTTYKGTPRNHFRAQFLGFRIGDKDLNAEDDLADAGFYGISVGLGNVEGF